MTSVVTSYNCNDLFTSHGYPGNLIQIWRTQGLKRVAKIIHHEERVVSLNLSADGEQLISSSADETLCFWNT